MRQRNLGVAGEKAKGRGNDVPSKSLEQNDVNVLEVSGRRIP